MTFLDSVPSGTALRELGVPDVPGAQSRRVCGMLGERRKCGRPRGLAQAVPQRHPPGESPGHVVRNRRSLKKGAEPAAAASRHERDNAAPKEDRAGMPAEERGVGARPPDGFEDATCPKEIWRVLSRA